MVKKKAHKKSLILRLLHLVDQQIQLLEEVPLEVWVVLISVGNHQLHSFLLEIKQAKCRMEVFLPQNQFSP